MNRELKFRVWDKKNNKFWHDMKPDFQSHGIIVNSNGFPGIVCDIEGQDIKTSNLRNVFIFDKEFLIIQQYTGLKDKNNKEIYEGDIVKDLDGDNCTVEFENGSFIIKGKLMIISFWAILAVDGMLSPRVLSSKTFEIIGNIFENPELLKND